MDEPTVRVKVDTDRSSSEYFGCGSVGAVWDPEMPEPAVWARSIPSSRETLAMLLASILKTFMDVDPDVLQVAREMAESGRMGERRPVDPGETLAGESHEA